MDEPNKLFRRRVNGRFTLHGSLTSKKKWGKKIYNIFSSMLEKYPFFELGDSQRAPIYTVQCAAGRLVQNRYTPTSVRLYTLRASRTVAVGEAIGEILLPSAQLCRVYGYSTREREGEPIANNRFKEPRKRALPLATLSSPSDGGRIVRCSGYTPALP